MEELTLTKQEVAQALKVSVATVDRLMSRRELPFVKIGQSVRFNAADIRQYVAEHTVYGRWKPSGLATDNVVQYKRRNSA